MCRGRIGEITRIWGDFIICVRSETKEEKSLKHYFAVIFAKKYTFLAIIFA